MDLKLLSDRIKQQRKTVSFYTQAVEMLIEYCAYDTFYSLEEMRKRFTTLPDEFITTFSKGEAPSEDIVLRIDTEDLDSWIQDGLFACGFVYGIHLLESEDYDCSGYISELFSCRNNPDMAHVVYAFAALSLAMQRPPSAALLLRFAPPTDNEEFLIQTYELITEMNIDLVVKYIQSKEEDA